MTRGESSSFGAGWLRGILRLAAIPYGIGVRIRNLRYDRGRADIRRLRIPVICVGNLTLGGTGKTPMVAWICRWLRSRHVRVAIVSRGYGARHGGMNDEALELEQLLPDVPHLQNVDRVAAAAVAQDELQVELVLMDDGFQHRRLHRDLDIVLIDATDPFGGGRLFPGGFLREPLAGLRRADAVVLTRSDRITVERRRAIRSDVERFCPGTVWVEMSHQPSELLNSSGTTATLDRLRNSDVAAFCGIGNPQGFEQTLESCGCHLKAHRTFADHHVYTIEDVRSLEDWARELDVEMILCTHKDLVKIGLVELGGKPLWAVAVRMAPQSAIDELEQLLESTTAGQTTSI